MIILQCTALLFIMAWYYNSHTVALERAQYARALAAL